MKNLKQVGIGMIIVLGFLMIVFNNGLFLGLQWQDMCLFVSRYIKNPYQVGAILPSSQGLANAISCNIEPSLAGFYAKNFLEVGAGEGAFTKVILSKIGLSDHLDVIEIDQEFADRLKQKFANDKRVTIHCCSILDEKINGHYDAIVSGLPFNSFEPNFVEAVFKKYFKLAKKGSIISFFEYRFIPSLKEFFLQGEDKARYQENIAIKKRYLGAYGVGKQFVNYNIPPAVVYHLKAARAF